MFARLFLCSALIFGAFGFVFSATGDAKAQNESEKAVETDLFAAQTDALNGKVKNIMESVSMDEVKHFSMLYSNYTIYSMVKAVRKDVANAAQACADNNSSIKKKVKTKFKNWDGTLDKTMKEAYGNINNLALAQNYISQSEVKQIFGLVDQIRAKNSSRFEKIPVTTPEACEFMLSKMDETSESLNGLLNATIISYPSLLKQTQE